jgi:hypothetical protein
MRVFFRLLRGVSQVAIPIEEQKNPQRFERIEKKSDARNAQ